MRVPHPLSVSLMLVQLLMVMMSLYIIKPHGELEGSVAHSVAC